MTSYFIKPIASSPQEETWVDKSTPMVVDDHYLSHGLSPPQRIGFFSSRFSPSGKSIYRPDRTSLSILDPAYRNIVGTDLLEGYSPEKGWGRGSAGSFHILKWLSDNKDQLKGQGQSCDFICHSRPLKSILMTQLPTSDTWKIYAIKVRGSIILNEFDTEERVRNVPLQHNERIKGSYAGYKFVEEITRRVDGSKPITYPGGNRNSFHLVNRWRVKSHSLIYSYRVDCALDEGQLTEPFNQMSLAFVRTRSSHVIFKKDRKLDRSISWWATSLVSGVAPIICGEKTRKHRVRKIVTRNGFQEEIPTYILRDRISFLDKVLTVIKENVDEELIVFCFEMTGEGQIVRIRINEPVEKYIPSWYLNRQSYDQSTNFSPSSDINRMMNENCCLFSPILSESPTKDSIIT